MQLYRSLWTLLFTVLVATLGCASPPNEDGESDSTTGPALGKISSAIVTVSTDKTSYPMAGTVSVTWAGTPGNARDWVALVPVGAPSSQFVRFAYLNSATSGTLSIPLTAAAKGNFEARIFLNDTYTLIGTSNPFHVGPLVSTDKSTYGVSDSIVVTFDQALAGNGLDWLAITPVGGNAQSYVRWAYTGGVVSGSQSFPAAAITGGTYEARLYGYNDVLQASSAPFTIAGRTVTTDKPSYLSTETAVVSFSGAVASGTDWLALIPEGSPDSAYARWQYTNQQPTGSGSFSLAGLASGNYVVKLFSNNTLNLQATSSLFAITGGNTKIVAADKASYLAQETAHVTFTSVPPTALDWIAIAPVGSSTYLRWQYMGGAATGQLDFPISGLPSGSYEARLYANNVLDLQATSAAFTVSAFNVSADKASYLRTETAQISFTAAPATAFDWISITPVGAPESSYLRWAYTNGVSNGSVGFALSDLPAGSYVARLYANNTLDLRATSAAFSVSGIAVSTTKPSFASNEQVVVAFSGFPGNAQDWIAIATPGSAAGTFVAWSYANGEVSGTRSFTLPTGTYVARMHINNENAIAAESTTFAVVPPLTIITPSEIQILVGMESSSRLMATGGVPPLTWSLAPGSTLPPNLTLSSSGVISGVATAPGTTSFTALVIDSSSLAAERTFSLSVLAPNPFPTLDAVAPAVVTIGSPATLTLTGSGFVSSSDVYVDDSMNGVTKSFVSNTEIQITVATSRLTLGSHAVKVVSPSPGGGTTTTRSFAVYPENMQWSSLVVGGRTCGYTVGSNQLFCTGPAFTPVEGTVFPTPLFSNPAFQQLSLSSHACGLSSGQLYCWGYNDKGQAGVTSSTPALLFSGTSFAKVSAGRSQSCAITNTGALRCWGSGWGSPGSPSNAISGSYTDVSSSQDLVCAIDATGKASCYGPNSGSFGSLATQTFTKISAQWLGACGLRSDGDAYCWGDNSTCHLGIGDTGVLEPTPKRVLAPAGVTFADVQFGCFASCGLSTTGSVYCWGRSLTGTPGAPVAHTPVLVPGLPTMASIAVDVGEFACGISTTGQRWCWGTNSQGQLGDGKVGNSTVPRRLP